MSSITTIDKVLYTGKTHTTGGREGQAQSSDGRLDIKLSPPGSAGKGTNPEQLFAAGWSACFIGAMGRAAGMQKVTLPAGVSVDAEVDLGTAGDAFFLQARLNVSLPGLAGRDSPQHRGCRPPAVPLLQGHARQHRRDDQSGLIPHMAKPACPFDRAGRLFFVGLRAASRPVPGFMRFRAD
jgi:osmotically inducible protein OsmC